MPLIVAGLVRILIQAVVQTGLWFGISALISPLIDKAKEVVKDVFDMTDEEAEDSIANEVIDGLAMVGIIGVGIKTKLPTKAAEKLGFTSKGYSKRPVSAKLKGKAGSTTKLATSKAKATPDDLGTIAEVTAKTRGINGSFVSSLFNNTLKVAGLTTGMFFALAQYIDFANWQGPYQKFFQGTLSIIGINPDTPLPKANTISADNWKRIYSVVEEMKPMGLTFPFENADRPYSRANLADLVDSVAANLQMDGVNPTYKTVIAVVLPLIQLTTTNRTDASIDAIFAKYGTSTAPKTTSVSVPTITKVFTGIVSQGVVGEGLVFTPRPDDLIESAEELRTAAANNLAPFLNTLLGKIVYEVKVVSSIITREGFRQRGQTQKIQTGNFSNGQPKYKTVTNKFATLVVYALTDKGSRAKLTTIVLGPTDSAKLTIGQNDLSSLESELPSLVTTTDIQEIAEIKTPAPVVVTPPSTTPVAPVATPPAPAGSWFFLFSGSATNGIKYYRGPFLDAGTAWKETNDVVTKYPSNQPSSISWSVAQNTSGYSIDPKWGSAPTPTTAPVVSGGGTGSQKLKANATTLFEWYSAQGWTVPTVQIRSTLYQNLGLGQASFYTGTAEQNTKLLNALKVQQNSA